MVARLSANYRLVSLINLRMLTTPLKGNKYQNHQIVKLILRKTSKISYREHFLGEVKENFPAKTISSKFLCHTSYTHIHLVNLPCASYTKLDSGKTLWGEGRQVRWDQSLSKLTLE